MSASDSPVIDKVEQTKSKLKTPTLWTVVLHNDDFTPMDFVMAVLREVFHLDDNEAFAITMKVHTEGKSAIGTFTKEIALSKAAHVVFLAKSCEHPLLATAEEL